MSKFAIRRISIHIAALVFGLATQYASAAIQLAPIPINAEDGSRLGYAHVFEPSQQDLSRDYQPEPIVYVPGFAIDLANLIQNSSTGSVGSHASANQLLRELVLTDSALPASQHPQFLESLIDNHKHTVIVLEYAAPYAGIEHNALALERLLTHPLLPVRQHYQESGTRSLILGWSMGGLVARYALSKMEFEDKEHFSSLYISFDAPHQGANLPLSLEAFVALMKHVLADNRSTLQLPQFESLLAAAQQQYNSTSAKEMLIPHLGIQSDSAVLFSLYARYAQLLDNPTNSAASSEFYSLRDKLLLLGQYPSHVRKIAFSNGNLLGNKLPLPQPRAGNELLRLSASVPITRRYKLRVMDLRLFDDSSDRARRNCSIKFMFETTRCTHLVMPETLANLSAGVGSYTNVISRLAEVFENQLTLRGEWQDLGYRVEFQSYVPAGEGNTTFIPMSSAFDLFSSNLNPSALSTELSPFDSIYANTSENMPHNAVAPEVYDALINDIVDTRQHQKSLQSLPAMVF